MGVLLADPPDTELEDALARLVEEHGVDSVRSLLPRPKKRGGRPKGSTTYRDLRALLLFTEARMTGEASSDREAGQMFAHLTDGNSEAAIVDRLRRKYRHNREVLENLVRLLWRTDEAIREARGVVREETDKLSQTMRQQSRHLEEQLEKYLKTLRA